MRHALLLTTILLVPHAARAQAPVELVSDPPGRVSFHLLTGSAIGPHLYSTGFRRLRVDAFDRLCVAPCTAQLPLGVQFLGLSLDDGDALRASQPISVAPGMRVRGIYHDQSGARAAGWTILAVSVAAGLAVMGAALAITAEDPEQTELPWILVGIGGGIALVGGTIGAIMAFTSDGAEVRIEPTAALLVR